MDPSQIAAFFGGGGLLFGLVRFAYDHRQNEKKRRDEELKKELERKHQEAEEKRLRDLQLLELSNNNRMLQLKVEALEADQKERRRGRKGV